jgi:hypothetical protein
MHSNFIHEPFDENPFTKRIYINNTSLSHELCREIIDLYEKDKLKHQQGVVMSGARPEIKDTTDLTLNTDDDNWCEIRKILIRELRYNIDKYAELINNPNDFKSSNNNSNHQDYKNIKPETLSSETIMVQKYKMNKGRYVYHDDHRVVQNSKMQRVITFIWYLNDVIEGGETVFDGIYKIRPRSGKLVLFPASWTFPHCGKMPLSSDKYIITGWIYGPSPGV